MSDPAKAIAIRLSRCCDGLAELRLRQTQSSEWQSLLFDGARHRITIELGGERPMAAAEAIRAAVATPFDIPGHLIADIRVAAAEPDHEAPTLVVEALTVQITA